MSNPSTPGKEPSPLDTLPDDLATITEQLSILDSLMPHTRRDIFHRVINAQIVPMGKNNLRAVGERYMRYWLSPADLAKLKQPGMEEEVENTLRGGRFIEHFSKPSRHGGVSIHEQMEYDLTTHLPGHGEYFGYALMAGDTREVLGFITGRKPLRPGEKINASYHDRMLKVLANGVTGGTMKYTDEVQMPKRMFEAEVANTLEIDTVAGEPFSVSRLLAETVPDIIGEQRRTRVNLYRLYGLQMNPALASPDVMDRIGENDKSDDFFRSVGARQFAIDQNPEGPSVSHMVDGEQVTVTPYWTWMTATGKTFRKRVVQKWEAQKRAMGHYSG